ncbi:sensor histidine kinase [Leptolyngbya sp. 7M]|uniref:sensor histidine kinase n=1 Tax=Leptolyngbya sp. 7M TaxID=2812896 RepID=UPI001B8CA1D7|nr:ATP-binding protein [Leptolyngbya sp. 7M]QYO67976.1 HAMP domain-containing protein [Leptolyngbya sp. 7M]
MPPSLNLGRRMNPYTLPADQVAADPPTQIHPNWRLLLRETRTRIWMWYIGLIVLFIGLLTPVTYRIVSEQVNQRLREEVVEEVAEFRQELATAQIRNTEQLRRFMLDYLQTEPIEEDQYFIAILQQQFLQASPVELPEAMQPGSELMEIWQTLQQPTHGEQSVRDPAVIRVIYYAEPIEIAGVLQGTFLSAYIAADEHREVRATMRTVILVKLTILLIASLIAWLVCGRVLRPLRTMARTARSISESDLSRRLQVEGNDELAEVAKTFNEMMDRLQGAFTGQQQFINDVSHELRTPITIIEGHLELMGDDPVEQQETLALVADELDRMKRFVNDLLLLAKADQPDFLRPEVVELGTFLDELHSKAKVLAVCECSLAIEPEIATQQVYLDRQRITQAVLNLVNNAVQHTPIDGRITLGATIAEAKLRLWVRDTGTGIALADQQRIFQRFIRLSGPQRSEGAGLGLAIVQAIVQACNGHVELDSQVGRGSTFTLVLPLLTCGQRNQSPQSS